MTRSGERTRLVLFIVGLLLIAIPGAMLWHAGFLWQSSRSQRQFADHLFDGDAYEIGQKFGVIFIMMFFALGVALVRATFKASANTSSEASQKPLGRPVVIHTQADLPPASTAAGVTSVEQMREHVKMNWSDKRGDEDHA